MRIAVLGAGGIGGYFGGRLAGGGHQVSFLARGAHLQAIRENGLQVESVRGDFVVPDAVATDDPGQVGPVDLVLLAVKTWQLDDAIGLLPPLLGPHTAVLTTQNGVEAPDQVAGVVGRPSVLPGIAKIFAMIAAPGRIRHGGGPASLSFAEWDDVPSARVEDLREAFTAAGIATPAPDGIWSELWAKFLFVVPLGGLGAALDATVGELRDTPAHRQLLEDAMREIEAVARANEVTLPTRVVPRTMAFVDQQPAEATTSLQRDLLAGHPSELDAWTGAVVRLGAQADVPVPLHRLLMAVLTARYPDALPALSGLRAGKTDGPTS